MSPGARAVAPRVGPDDDRSDVPTHTTTLVFPGVQTRTDLTDDDHPHSAAVRDCSTTMWALHGRGDSR